MSDKPERLNVIVTAIIAHIVQDSIGEIERILDEAEKTGKIFVKFKGKSGEPIIIRYRKIDAVLKYKHKVQSQDGQPGGGNVIKL